LRASEFISEFGILVSKNTKLSIRFLRPCCCKLENNLNTMPSRIGSGQSPQFNIEGRFRKPFLISVDDCYQLRVK